MNYITHCKTQVKLHFIYRESKSDRYKRKIIELENKNNSAQL